MIKYIIFDTAQKEGEPCGLGIEEGKLLECRKDLECAFSETELLGTCQVKSKLYQISFLFDSQS